MVQFLFMKRTYVKQEWKDAVINLEYERTHINNSDISKDRYVLNKI